MINREKVKGFMMGVILTAVFSMSFSAFAASVQKQITVLFSGVKVTVDGKEVALKDANGTTLEPIGYDGSVYTPARAVAEALGAVVAWDQTNNTVKITSRQNGAPGGNMSDPSQTKKKLQEILESMVSKGTITRDEADRLLKYYDNGETADSSQQPEKRSDPLSEAVTDGVITKAQADAIRQEMMPAPRQEN